MLIKSTLKWMGIAGVIALAACTPTTGPLSDCVTGEDNVMSCSTPTSEPAEAGIEQIVQ
jgi:hypothetical protein